MNQELSSQLRQNAVGERSESPSLHSCQSSLRYICWRSKQASLLSCQLGLRYSVFIYLYIYIFIYLYAYISTCLMDLGQNGKTDRQNDDAR